MKAKAKGPTAGPARTGRPTIRHLARSATWGAALLVAALVALLASAPLLLSGDLVRERVVAHLERVTGATVRVSRSHVALYPRPRVVMENVRLGSVHLGGGNARVDRLEVDVALWAALRGRIVPTALRVERPNVVLRRRAGPGAMLAALLPSGVLPWPKLSVHDGRIEWRGAQALRFSALDASVTRRARGVTLAGSAVWNGEPISFTASTNDLEKLLREGAPARLGLEANPLSLAFDGRIAPTTGRAAGHATIETASMERAVEWLNLGSDAPAVPASLTGDVTATPRQAAFRDAVVSIADTRAEGSLSAERVRDDRGPRLAVAGTLAFDDVDVSAAPLARAMHASRTSAARADLRLPHLRALDLDLRLSATRMRLAGVAVEDVAATLRSSRRATTLTLGDATLGGGRAQGRMRVESRRGAMQATLALTMNDVDLAALPLPDQEHGLQPSGRGKATLALLARGRTPDEMLASLTGRASLTLRDGTLGGFDLLATGRATRTGRLPRQENVWSGSTPFAELSAKLRLSDGVATLSHMRLIGRPLAAQVRGRVDLVRGAIALRGEVASVLPDADADANAWLRPGAAGFFVGGTILTPLLVPLQAIDVPPEAHRSG